MALDQKAFDVLRIDRASGSKPAPTSPKPSDPSPRRAVPRIKILAASAAGVLLATAGAVALLNDSFHPFSESEIEVGVAVVAAPQLAVSSTVLDASGYVVARRKATVSTRIMGKVAEVLVDEGSEVDAGDVLARLDDSAMRPRHELAVRQLDQTRKDLREVQVRLAEAQKRLERTRRLGEKRFASVAELDAAEAEASALSARLEALVSTVSVAEGNVKVIAQELDDLIVRAPFAGVIVSRDAEPGEVVSPISVPGGFSRSSVATLVDMSSREVEVDVNETYLQRLRPGQRAESILDAYPDAPLGSRVSSIAPTADREKATVKVRIMFDALEPHILPDMGVKVRFKSGDAEQSDAAAGVRIPASALFQEEGRAHVWLVQDNVVERRPVRVAAAGDPAEITSGLVPGDVIVERPVERLREGARVKVKGVQ